MASQAPNVYLFGGLLVGCGLLTLLFLTGANSLVQLSSAPTVRGRVMSVYVLVLLGGQAIGGPTVGWSIDRLGARSSMLWCGGLIVLLAMVAGAAMAYQSHLRVEIDLHREHGHSPVHIVHSRAPGSAGGIGRPQALSTRSQDMTLLGDHRPPQGTAVPRHP